MSDILKKLTPEVSLPTAALAATLALGAYGLANADSEPVVTARQARLDDLRTGHHPVKVYDKSSLRGDYGEFPDGYHLDAECKFIGKRVIRSNTRIGERRMRSEQEFKVNLNEFVSVIYVKNRQDLQTLPNC